MRGGQSKKSDEAAKAIGEMGKGEFFYLLLGLIYLIFFCVKLAYCGNAD